MKSLGGSKGFTLAEVLIVIAIIGVVAAMTIPTLMSSYHKKITETRLLDTYAILSQALRMSQNENGTCDGWDFGDISHHRDAQIMEEWWKTYFEPYLSKSLVTTLKTNDTSMSGADQYIVYLKNGSAIGIEALPGDYVWFWLIPDSGKIIKHTSKNIWKIDGLVRNKDYFRLDIFTKDAYYQPACTLNPVCTSNDYKSACLAKSSMGCCTEYLRKNNWKIPKDYPIKF